MRSSERSPAGEASLEERTVRVAALRLLARREHSVDELRRKLLAKGHPMSAVDSVIAKLSAKQLVSDQRFVAGFVRQHAARGQGPVRIRAELRTQGIVETAIDHALEEAEIDWAALAGRVRQRKFGSARAGSLAERAKQSRFLQYRGFSAEQIRAALAGAADEEGGWVEAD